MGTSAQAREKRKAFGATAGPTYCSGSRAMVRNGTGGRRHLIPQAGDQPDARRLLRAEMRLRRRRLSGARRQLATRAIVRKLLMLPAYHAASSIALYWPADGEPDIRGLAAHARAHGKRLYLPVVGQAGQMRFAAWPGNARLKRNRYGIPEPIGTRRLKAADLAMLVVPLVAFDGAGNRLGMGGGYYDRALAGLRRRPVLVGAAFSVQQVRGLPVQPWDVPLDIVITEHGRSVMRNTRRAAGKNARRGEPR